MTLRDQRFTLAAATLGSFVALLDSTVVGIALPAIGGDLGGGLESQQWIVNAYLLALGSLILMGGSLGDVFGERRVFILGAAGFGVASAGCAVAPTVEALITARGLQMARCGAVRVRPRGSDARARAPARSRMVFVLSKRFGALADRFGPRRFMAAGPLVSSVGVIYLLATIDESPGLLVDILPGMTICAFGLATLVSPLTAAVLADADARNAGIASGVNDAVARVAGLLAAAAVGTIAGGTLDVGGLRMALAGTATLLVLGGITGLFAIRDPRRAPVVVPARAPAG